MIIHLLIPTERGRSWTKSTIIVADLILSIEKEGLLNPLSVYLYQEKYYVINGHHRLEALKRLGYDDVPINELSDNDLRSYDIAPATLPHAAFRVSEEGRFKVDGRLLRKRLIL